jgi:hypothetical protein
LLTGRLAFAISVMMCALRRSFFAKPEDEIDLTRFAPAHQGITYKSLLANGRERD